MPDDLVDADNRQALAIDNVHLITMIGDQVLMNRQLLVRHGRIEEIRPSGSPTGADYQLIDGDGSYVMPGLIDTHVHAFDRKYLVLSLAYGITTVRNMGGYPMHLRWRSEINDGLWLGSNLIAGTPILNGSKNANPMAHKVITDPNTAREMIRKYHDAGWDFVKVYTRLSPEVYAALIDEAAKLDFPVAGHVPYAVVEADYRLAAPMVSLEHTEEIFQGPLDYRYDDDAVLAIALQLKDMNATVTPTLMIFDHLTQIAQHRQTFLDSLPVEYLNPFMRFVEERTTVSRWLNASDQLRESLEKRNAYFQYMTRVLHDSGVNLILGSDSGIIYASTGFSTHEEIALLVRAGLPTSAILKMATINAAEALGVDNRLGSIKAGNIADLVVTRKNPITSIGSLRKPVAVVKNGQWLDEQHLERLSESAKNPSNAYFMLGRLFEFVLFG
jgi:imidazolonepropionase-like amidohydrolase